jgi:hypothetical protein
MAKQPKSDFNQLLTLVRRIIVLVIAAVGLARDWPYEAVAFRAAGLWAVLYICSLGIELMFQYLSFSALQRDARDEAERRKATQKSTTDIKPAI